MREVKNRRVGFREGDLKRKRGGGEDEGPWWDNSR